VTLDEYGVPVFSSARACLVELRGDVDQAITLLDGKLGIVTRQNDPALIPAAMAELVCVMTSDNPGLDPVTARKLIIQANSWASAGRWNKWQGRPRKGVKE
jgi:hypothetical protein